MPKPSAHPQTPADHIIALATRDVFPLKSDEWGPGTLSFSDALRNRITAALANTYCHQHEVSVQFHPSHVEVSQFVSGKVLYAEGATLGEAVENLKEKAAKP